MQGNRQGGGHRTTAGKPNVGPMAKRETQRLGRPLTALLAGQPANASLEHSLTRERIRAFSFAAYSTRGQTPSNAKNNGQ